MSTIQPSDAFGYHSNQQVYDKISFLAEGKPMHEQAEETLRIGNYIKSALNVAGYIPVIGTIIAIAKLVLISRADKEFLKSGDLQTEFVPSYKALSKGMKIRSAMELTSLGFLLVIPDLIFTIGRALQKNPEEQVA